MWLIVIGALSGILGSMGLGGGSILIPLLSLLSISQKSAQVINVFSFILMSIVSIFINLKTKMIDLFPSLVFGLLGGFVATIFALFVRRIEQQSIKICFGLFLFLVGFYEIFVFLAKYIAK